MPQVPETRKRAGVQYACTPEGLELPVVDITHPAFALDVGPDQQRQLIERFVSDHRGFSRFPKPVRSLLMRLFLRGSALAEGIRQSRGTYMTGIHTYLLKLGPEMLGEAYAKPIDRRIAASLPATNVRLRMQDVVRLMTGALVPALAAEPGLPLVFLNIAGGPAIDSLNAVMVLRKEHGEELGRRTIAVDVLDLDEQGAQFGKAALAALSQRGAPLEGTPVDFRHMPYNWSQTAALEETVRAVEQSGALAICSSEGGLFEYGTDDEIILNLAVLRKARNLAGVVGSVTRNDATSALLRESSGAAIRPRGLANFGEVAAKAGWKIAKAIERPVSDQVLLQ